MSRPDDHGEPIRVLWPTLGAGNDVQPLPNTQQPATNPPQPLVITKYETAIVEYRTLSDKERQRYQLELAGIPPPRGLPTVENVFSGTQADLKVVRVLAARASMFLALPILRKVDRRFGERQHRRLRILEAKLEQGRPLSAAEDNFLRRVHHAQNWEVMWQLACIVEVVFM